MERLACRDGYGASICIISVSIEVCLNLDIELPHVITLQLLIYPTGERAKDHLVQIGTIVNCVTRINNVVLVVFIIHIRVFPRSAISPPPSGGRQGQEQGQDQGQGQGQAKLASLHVGHPFHIHWGAPGGALLARAILPDYSITRRGRVLSFLRFFQKCFVGLDQAQAGGVLPADVFHPFPGQAEVLEEGQVLGGVGPGAVGAEEQALGVVAQQQAAGGFGAGVLAEHGGIQVEGLAQQVALHLVVAAHAAHVGAMSLREGKSRSTRAMASGSAWTRSGERKSQPAWMSRGRSRSQRAA